MRISANVTAVLEAVLRSGESLGLGGVFRDS